MTVSAANLADDERALVLGVWVVKVLDVADLIAAEISPGAPERAAMQAGRQMLDAIQERVLAKRSFAVETTLADRAYARMIPRWPRPDQEPRASAGRVLAERRAMSWRGGRGGGAGARPLGGMRQARRIR